MTIRIWTLPLCKNKFLTKYHCEKPAQRGWLIQFLSAVESDELALHDEACVVVFIGAGGQRDDAVVLCDLNVGGKVGLALHLGQPCGVILGRVKVAGVGVGVVIADVGGEYLDLVILLGGVEIHHGVLVIIALLLVIRERVEHRPILHVVTVHDGVRAGELRAALAVDKQRAAGVIGAVEQVVQVLIVVRALSDGVIDDGVLAVKPAAHVAVLREKLVKIDLDGGDLLVLLRGISLRHGGKRSGGGVGGNKLLAHFVV